MWIWKCSMLLKKVKKVLGDKILIIAEQSVISVQ